MWIAVSRMGRSVPLAVVACLLLTSCASNTNTPGPISQKKDGRSPIADGDRPASQDLKLLQGTWERQIRPEEKVPYKRCVKHIDGSRESVTYYDEAGNVWKKHEVDFRLEQHGPVKVFTFYNYVVTEGEGKGTKTPQPRSYVYRLSGDELAEVWGFMPSQAKRPISFHMHKRVNPTAATAPSPAAR